MIHAYPEIKCDEMCIPENYATSFNPIIETARLSVADLGFTFTFGFTKSN